MFQIKQTFTSYSFLIISLFFLTGGISYATISWPTTPDGETVGGAIGSLMGAFTLDSWNVWIGKLQRLNLM